MRTCLNLFPTKCPNSNHILFPNSWPNPGSNDCPNNVPNPCPILTQSEKEEEEKEEEEKVEKDSRATRALVQITVSFSHMLLQESCLDSECCVPDYNHSYRTGLDPNQRREASHL